MSVRAEKIMALAGENFANKTTKEFQSLFEKTLNKGLYGLGFSPYLENQKPGDQISEEQIRRRMEIIKPYTKWVRSFSCTDGNEHIPRIAHEFGIKTLVGACLGTDEKINEKEIQNVIKIATEGYADIVAVGNEVMYRGDLSEDQLIHYIKRVKEVLPNIPVGYVDAYYEFEKRPKITEACDVILANCYPVWEYKNIHEALEFTKRNYYSVADKYPNKPVVITEAGWATNSNGRGICPSNVSEEYQAIYYNDLVNWSEHERILTFVFEAFDEPWKGSNEPMEPEKHWGLFKVDRSPKLVMKSVLAELVF